MSNPQPEDDRHGRQDSAVPGANADRGSDSRPPGVDPRGGQPPVPESPAPPPSYLPPQASGPPPRSRPRRHSSRRPSGTADLRRLGRDAVGAAATALSPCNGPTSGSGDARRREALHGRRRKRRAAAHTTAAASTTAWRHGRDMYAVSSRLPGEGHGRPSRPWEIRTAAVLGLIAPLFIVLAIISMAVTGGRTLRSFGWMRAASGTRPASNRSTPPPTSQRAWRTPSSPSASLWGSWSSRRSASMRGECSWGAVTPNGWRSSLSSPHSSSSLRSVRFSPQGFRSSRRPVLSSPSSRVRRRGSSTAGTGDSHGEPKQDRRLRRCADGGSESRRLNGRD